MAAAAVDHVVGSGRRGASTITMQLAALVPEARVPRPGRRALRHKIDQIQAARELERTWSKNQILEAYLNLITYRGELRGVGAAVQALFKKRPSGLTHTESLVLAALLPSPNAPAQRVADRACALARSGAHEASCQDLRRTTFQVLSAPPEIAPGAAAAPHLARRLLTRPGERVSTTLDAAIQRMAAEAIRSQLMGLGAQNVRDAAALVVDNVTGDVLVYVGSSGAHSDARMVDGVRALRQAGSTLKPILYATALERGFMTAASLVEDSPINLETAAGLYIPQNYDREFKGTASVRTALASSLNVPAVRTLVLTGLDAFHEKLRTLGYDSLTEDAEYYGYSLALGSAEVSLLEQVTAYRTLANGGLAGPLRFTPHDPTPAGRRVISSEAAFVISDILSDRAGRSVTFGLANALGTPFWTAVKTGTSKNMRDNWCIGYSRQYTVGVWVGNFEGDAMWDVSGVTGAAPIWLEIMQALHSLRPSRPPAPPPTLVLELVHFDPAVEPDRREWLPAGNAASTVRLTPPEVSAVRIEYPANGMILALDPDMPAANQAVLFRSSAHRAPLRWRLDGADLGGAGTPLLWIPTPGKHRLALLAEDDTTLDEVRFQVRGSKD
jgi:penicillin-binding protein 1C